MLTPYGRLMKRLIEIHGGADETGPYWCPTCVEPRPCDTMRSLWIFDLESDLDVAVGG